MLAAFDHAGRPRGPFEERLDEIAEAARWDLQVAANAEDAVRGLSALMPGYDADRRSRNCGSISPASMECQARLARPQVPARRALLC